MANSLSFTNFNRKNILAQTKLTADIAAGVSALPVGNSAAFTTTSGSYLLVGNVGSPLAELQSATTGGTNTSIAITSTTTVAHNFSDFVSLLFGNQIRVYRANDVYGNGTQPPDANFSLIATINITANSALTSYTDNTGVTGQWYKFTYYNAATGAETALADSRAAQYGATHYVSLDQVRDAAGFRNNTNVTDDIVAEKRDAAEKEVNGALQGVYDLPLPQPANPIIVEIVRNIAGGNLMAEMYTGVSAEKVAEGEAKAAKGRVGSAEDSTAGLAQLVDRSVVLLDANYIEETRDEAHGFGGWPDETTQDTTGAFSNEQLGQNGMDRGFEFYMNRRY